MDLTPYAKNRTIWNMAKQLVDERITMMFQADGIQRSNLIIGNTYDFDFPSGHQDGRASGRILKIRMAAADTRGDNIKNLQETAQEAIFVNQHCRTPGCTYIPGIVIDSRTPPRTSPVGRRSPRLEYDASRIDPATDEYLYPTSDCSALNEIYEIEARLEEVESEQCRLRTDLSMIRDRVAQDAAAREKAHGPPDVYPRDLAAAIYRDSPPSLVPQGLAAGLRPDSPPMRVGQPQTFTWMDLPGCTRLPRLSPPQQQ